MANLETEAFWRVGRREKLRGQHYCLDDDLGNTNDERDPKHVHKQLITAGCK